MTNIAWKNELVIQPNNTFLNTYSFNFRNFPEKFQSTIINPKYNTST